MDKEDGNKRKKREVTRILPGKFLGAGEASGPAPANTAAPAAAANAGAGSGGALSLADMGIPDDQQVQIKVKAKTQSYGDWVDFVMALPGALENGTLMSAIGDESFYTALKGD